MLLVWISSYLKSRLRYTFLIFDTYHPDTQYLHEQGYEDPWLFFEAKRVRDKKKLENTAGKYTYCILTAFIELLLKLENMLQFKQLIVGRVV